MAQPFDAGTRRFTGDGSPVAEQIAQVGAAAGRAFSVSSNRVLTYRTGANLTQVQLAWLDRTGHRLATLGETADYSNPALSPDGKRVAVGRRNSKTSTRDLWLFDLERGTASRLTFDPGDDFNPAFSPTDPGSCSRRPARARENIYGKASTGVGEDEPVLESENAKNVDDLSPDGRLVVYDTGGGVGAEAANDLGWRRSTATASRFRSWCGRSSTPRPGSRRTAASSPTPPTSRAPRRSTSWTSRNPPGSGKSRPTAGRSPSGGATGESCSTSAVARPSSWRWTCGRWARRSRPASPEPCSKRT